MLPLLTAIMMLLSFQLEAYSQYKPVQRGERPPIDLSNVPEEAYEKGIIRIKLEEDAYRAFSQQEMSRTETGVITFGLDAVDVLNAQYGVRDARGTFDSPALNNRYTERHRKWGFHLWYNLIVDEDADIISMVQDYMALTEVSFAEPHYKKELIGNVANEGEPETVYHTIEDDTRDTGWFPNDPQFDAQWHYHNTGQTGGTAGADISLPEAWTIETGNVQVIVAVVDGGIGITHPDLADNIWDGVGYNFVSNTPTIVPHNHGSHVGGTIAAVSNNNLGVSGIAGGWNGTPGVALMSAQVFEPGWGQSGGFEIAPVYAADNGAAISQNSWGYTSANYYEQAVLDAIDYFNINGGGEVMDGGLTIFAAGNSGNSNANYPGYYSGAMAVAALNHNDQLAWYSNYGAHIEISAPGGETNTVTNQGVLSTLNTGYDFYQGTSMACPHVSGVVALMLSMAPGEFDSEEIKNMLITTTDDVDGSNSGYVGQLGTGRVNAFAALNETLFNMADPDAPAAPTGLTITADPEGALSAEISWTNPTETASGETLTELDEINIYKGEDLIHVIQDPVIGEETTYTDDDINADGSYFYIIRGVNFAGEGLAVSGGAYIGHDRPAAPENIALSAAGDNAILTWEAPESGLNDGFFDGSNLTYTIHRFPGGDEVISETTETVLFDTEVPGIGNYFYEVTAVNHVGEGGIGTSNVATLGAEGLLIYEPFEHSVGELPTGWFIDGPGESNWGVHDSETAGGEAPQMRLNWSPSFTATSKLLTHEVDIAGYSELELSFRQFLRNYGSAAGEIAVLYTTDQRQSWTELMSFNEGSLDYGPVLEEFTLELTPDATTFQLAFRWDGNTFNIWDWNIDDVILEGIGAFYEVSIEVVDEEENPVTGATVTLDTKTGVEVIPGLYFFNQIEPGLHAYSVEKDGFEMFEGEIEVVDEHVIETVVLVEHRFTVNFNVFDQNEAELDDAIITFDGEILDAGVYTIDDITGGTYEYTAEKEGFHSVADTVIVDGDDVSEDVILELIVYNLVFEPITVDGDPIEGAMVILNGTEHTAGHYDFNDIVPGSYDYIIEKDMYFPAEGTVDVIDQDVFRSVVLYVDDTGINELAEYTIDIFPNPAQNRFTVESNLFISQLTLTDINGQLVKTIDVGAEQISVDINQLDAGIYFVRIYTDDEMIQTRRIQIIK